MDRGVVGMIDILGFKGITKTESADAIVDRLCQIRDFLRNTCQKATDNWAQSFGARTRFPPKPRVLMLSDTIMLAIRSGLDDRREVDRIAHEGNLINVCGYVIAQTLKFNTKFDPALVYRGAISVGDFMVEDTFMIGPAVDDAAEWTNEADGAMVLLTPGYPTEAQCKAPPVMENFATLFFDYEVPLKEGGERKMRVLNSLNECSTQEDQHDFLDGTKRAFRRTEGDSIRRKERNTIAYLERCRDLRMVGK